jgi:uncharacterized protein
VLRGFAMFGVLLAYCMWSLGTAPEESWSKLDKWLGGFFHFAGDGKFYTILAFLFGFGFSIQLSRAADGSHATETYCRRLAALAAIGLVHALLLRNGDILLPYALTGFFMIPFRRLSDRAVLAGAFTALLVPAAAHLLWAASGVPVPQRPSLENAPYLVENIAWVRYWYSTAIFSWPTNLTLFLFGLLAGRHHLLSQLANSPKTLVTIAVSGFAAGTALFLHQASSKARLPQSRLCSQPCSSPSIAGGCRAPMPPAFFLRFAHRTASASSLRYPPSAVWP